VKIIEVVPWLVRAEGTGWGEYLFVEVRTDEGVSGWGEITTTTPAANRGVAAMVRQVNPLLVGDDPARIEDAWHKIFRAFTYMGSRGAGTNVVSAIDIALWDIRGKVLGLPVCDLLGGRVRDDLLIYTHPDQRRFGTKEGVVEEIPRSSTRVTPASSSTRSRTRRGCRWPTTATSTAGSAGPSSGRRWS
jgi:galactonate dehydratase